MPHLHVEYSDNLQLEVAPVLMALNQALFDTGLVGSAQDIKSRAVRQSDYLIGLSSDSQQAYVHVKLSILTGRSIEIQQQMSEILLQALQASVTVQAGMSVQMCVEVLEMQKALYSKTVLLA